MNNLSFDELTQFDELEIPTEVLENISGGSTSESGLPAGATFEDLVAAF